MYSLLYKKSDSFSLYHITNIQNIAILYSVILYIASDLLKQNLLQTNNKYSQNCTVF